MAELDYKELLEGMLTAGRSVLADAWPEVADIATSSFKTLALTLTEIGKMKKSGVISEEQARLLLNMHKNTARIILLSVELKKELKAEAAINAALDAIKIPVNAAVGFDLL
jgi:hypothetical protein